MAVLDIDVLSGQIVAALRAEVSTGFRKASAFASKQARLLAAQAALITEGRISGQIDVDLFKFFSKQLKEMTLNFARSFAALTIITLERAWNAIVGVVWGAMNRALQGAGLGSLAVPKVPNL